MKRTMTLGDFRKYTEHLSNDIELNYHHGGEYHPIRTFANNGDNTLVLVTSNWGIQDIEGIIETIVSLKKKEE